MEQQIFTAYMRFQQLPDDTKVLHGIRVGAKIPRYDLTHLAGYYRPLVEMANRKGQVILYLSETRGIINSVEQRRADRFLMGRNSLNFSSVFLYGESNRATGQIIGFGNPYNGATYGGKNKHTNPFKDNRNDGFLFVISPDWLTIEVLVIPNGIYTIQGNAEALKNGVYAEALDTMRATARAFFDY